MTKRIRIKLRPYQRNLIAYNQKYKCKSCFEFLRPTFHIDHIIPISQGGDNSLQNMQALCYNCHGIKSESDFQDLYELKKRLNKYWSKKNLQTINLQNSSSG